MNAWKLGELHLIYALNMVFHGSCVKHIVNLKMLLMLLSNIFRPKDSGAQLPKTDVAVWVAPAEKLHTLVGMFGIGQKPAGKKDPFAFRRPAIGILRI